MYGFNFMVTTPSRSFKSQVDRKPELSNYPIDSILVMNEYWRFPNTAIGGALGDLPQ